MKVKIDNNNQSLMRIEEKCIDCGQCLAICKERNNLVDGDCINCGACILTCPMGALVPKFNYKEVLANIHDEEKIVVVSISPAVRVAIGDDFGYEPGEFLEGKLVGALKEIGFDYVFDTTFGADLTIMEEATELVDRLNENKNLPMFTSCCPSWVLNMEKYHEKDLNNLSKCKSPISMQSSIIRNYFTKVKNLNPEDIVIVALAPCVSKKSEIKRDGLKDTDYVITTSELSLMIRENCIDFKNIKEKEFDSLLSKGSGAGIIFGVSGGVMIASLRYAYYLLNKTDAPDDFFSLKSFQGNNEFKTAEVNLGIKTLKVAVVYGINNVNKLYDKLKDYDYVEVMSCINGCVGGGGQPLVSQNKQKEYILARGNNLFKNDNESKVRVCYKNEDIKRIYTDFLGEKNGDKSKKYLHTYYENKSRDIKIKS